MVKENLNTYPELEYWEGGYSDVVYFPGLEMTQKASGELEGMMSTFFGFGTRVMTCSCPISMEPQDLWRWEEAVEAIGQLRSSLNKRKLVLVQSMGAGVFGEVFKKAEKRFCQEGDFYQAVADNVDFVMVSPAGMVEGWPEGWGLMRRTFKELHNEIRYAIDSLYLVPIQGMRDREVLTMIRKVFGGLEDEEGLEWVPYSRGITYISQAVEAELGNIDYEIMVANRNENIDEVREFLLARGRLLKSLALYKERRDQGVFERSHGGIIPSWRERLQNWLRSKYSYWQERSLLKIVLNGDTERLFEKLKLRGARFGFLVPERDVVLPFEKIREFLGKEDMAGNVVIMEGGQHSDIFMAPERIIGALDILMNNWREEI